MPELPEIEAYLHALRDRIVGETLERVRVASPSLLRTWDPPLGAAHQRMVRSLRRIGKRIVWDMGDELFLVISGRLVIQLRDADGGDVELGPGDVYVVPRGVEHCPRADGEVSAMLIEPKGTVNTGDTPSARTARLRELDE